MDKEEGESNDERDWPLSLFRMREQKSFRIRPMTGVSLEDAT